MGYLTNLTVSDFLIDLADNKPTPGGGSASALAGAMGAALVCMACNLTVGREKFAAVEEEMRDVLKQAHELQKELLHLIDGDTEAYQQVADAYKLPRGTDEEKEARKKAIQAALRVASDVPLQVAKAAAAVIPLARIAQEKSNPNVASDAAVAVMMAEAGRDGAIANVEINLGSITDEEYVQTMRAEVERLRSAG